MFTSMICYYIFFQIAQTVVYDGLHQEVQEEGQADNGL